MTFLKKSLFYFLFFCLFGVSLFGVENRDHSFSAPFLTPQTLPIEKENSPFWQRLIPKHQEVYFQIGAGAYLIFPGPFAGVGLRSKRHPYFSWDLVIKGGGTLLKEKIVYQERKEKQDVFVGFGSVTLNALFFANRTEKSSFYFGPGTAVGSIGTLDQFFGVPFVSPQVSFGWEFRHHQKKTGFLQLELGTPIPFIAGFIENGLPLPAAGLSCGFYF